MEVVSFIFGMLAMVVVLFFIIIVVGFVKIKRLSQDVERIDKILEDNSRVSEDEFRLVQERITESMKESTAYTDKRVDLVLNKIKV